MTKKINNSKKNSKKNNKIIDIQSLKNKNNGLTSLTENIGNTFNTFAPGMGAPISSVASMYANNRYYLLTLQRSVLEYTYNEHGIIRTFVDQPVDDGFRGGLNINSPELDSDDIDLLNKYIKDNDIMKVFTDSSKWGRLFGGGAVIINTDDSDSTEPFDINKVNKNTKLEFYSADRWELSGSNYDKNVYRFKQENNLEEEFNYYGTKIHNTRVIKIIGRTATSFIRMQLQGWGLSILESIVRPFNKFLKNSNVTYELLDEAKIDVYKIDGYNISLAQGQDEKIKQKVMLTNMMKNYLNALVMDKEDDYDQKQLSFAGLSDMLQQNRIEIASEGKFPLTKLFGLSASGFNAGEDDIENYNSMVESEVRTKAEPMINQVTSIICKKLFGFVPILNIEFESLRVLSSEQEENVKTSKTDRVMRFLQAGLITSDEAVDVINKENLLGIKIQGKSKSIISKLFSKN